MSELRQDLVSGDWVIIAPGRAARPHFLDEKKQPRKPQPIAACPFENLGKSGNEPILSWPNAKHWRIAMIPNKYPALMNGDACSVPFRHGIYKAKTGIGHHYLLITRDHKKNFADIDLKTATKLFEIIQDRYKAEIKDGCNEYFVPFFNWGPAAGASVWHPHYQLLSLPAIPSHTQTSLQNAEAYFKKHHRCVRCDIIKAERKEGKRVIAENKNAIAIAPYASKIPFEIMILPKKHSAYFRDASEAIVKDTAALLQSVMKQLRRNANDPDFNFFIHDAPLGKNHYDYHHWHIEVLPRVSIPAGFEFSTGMFINSVEPEKAAAMLKHA